MVSDVFKMCVSRNCKTFRHDVHDIAAVPSLVRSGMPDTHAAAVRGKKVPHARLASQETVHEGGLVGEPKPCYHVQCSRQPDALRNRNTLPVQALTRMRTTFSLRGSVQTDTF